jgi:hypothetical protein
VASAEPELADRVAVTNRLVSDVIREENGKAMGNHAMKKKGLGCPVAFLIVYMVFYTWFAVFFIPDLRVFIIEGHKWEAAKSTPEFPDAGREYERTRALHREILCWSFTALFAVPILVSGVMILRRSSAKRSKQDASEARSPTSSPPDP